MLHIYLRAYSNECVQYVTVLKPKTRNYTEKDDIMLLRSSSYKIPCVRLVKR